MAVAFVLLILFFAIRLYHLGFLPIFTDEAIYVRWAQIAKFDPVWRFISLTDGKQPLFMWGSMIAMRFIDDPLLAARFVSVLAGLASATGLFFLTRELFKNKWIGIIASFLYIIYPFALVYDRIALYDSLVGALAIWNLFLLVLLVRTGRIDVALIFGMVLGAGVLNKTSGFISAYLMPLGILLVDLSRKDRVSRIARLFLLVLLAFGLMYMHYSILRLSPFFHIVDEKNTIFYYPLREWLTHPFNFFEGNFKGLWDWVITYVTWPVILLIGGSLLIDRKYFREKVFLLLWFLIPFSILALIGKVLYPRFIFFMTLYLLPLAAYSLYALRLRIKNTVLYASFCLLVVLALIRSDFFILTDFAHAPIPRIDLGQYINGWPAGGGVKEAIVFFEEEAKKGKVLVITQGTFGLFPFAFEIYLKDNPNITVSSFWPVTETPPSEAVEKNSSMLVYLVFYQPCLSCPATGEAPITWKLEKVLEFKKGIGEESKLTIYRLPTR